MIRNYLHRKLAEASIAGEEYSRIDGFSRRALGMLAGAALFGGLTNVVRASPCTSMCQDPPRCNTNWVSCTDSCGGTNCWESEGGVCCDYECELETFSSSFALCCSEWEGPI